MRINATSRGRKGDVAKAVGSLTLRTDCDEEAFQLKCLYRELRNGNFGFWAPLMFAFQHNMVTKPQEALLTKIVNKVKKDFLKEVEEIK